TPARGLGEVEGAGVSSTGFLPGCATRGECWVPGSAGTSRRPPGGRFFEIQALLGDDLPGGVTGTAFLLFLPAAVVGVVVRVVPVVFTGAAGDLVEDGADDRRLRRLRDLLRTQDHALRVPAVLDHQRDAVDRTREDRGIADSDDRRRVEQDPVVTRAQLLNECAQA